MDAVALSTANILAGNASSAAGLEWALGGGTIRVERASAFALAGPDVEATLDGEPLAMYTTYHAKAGSLLSIQRFNSGRFAYVALEGGIDVPTVMGSRSTYLPARFGGFGGRLLRVGDRVTLGVPAGDGAGAPRTGFTIPRDLLPPYASTPCRVLAAGSGAFETGAWEQLVSATFHIEGSSDRTGYRLTGHSLGDAGSTISEPVCPGVVQVPRGGQPIVLMADGPTVGGYRIVAVVASVDLPLLAQRQPGREVRFAPVSLAEAHRAAKRQASSIHTIRHLAAAGRF
jgi:antagonist of KipI